MKHLWQVTKTIRDEFSQSYEMESGDADSLTLAKKMAREAHQRMGGGRNVRARISRPEEGKAWRYESGRRAQMVWREYT